MASSTQYAAGTLLNTTTDPASAQDGATWLRSDEAREYVQSNGVALPVTPACTLAIMYPSMWYRPGVGNAGTQLLTLNRAYAMPLMVPRKFVVTDLAIGVTTGVASAVLRLGLFGALSTGLPGARIVDAGTVSGAASSTGLVRSVSGSPTLYPGLLYYVVVASQVAACTVRTRVTDDPLLPDPSSTPNLANTNNALCTDTGFSGAFPSTFGAVASASPVVAPEYAIRGT